MSKIYGQGDTEVRALDDVSVAFPSGRFTAIMGPSGSGKSTLMHICAGLDAPSSGRTFVGDVDLTTLKDSELTVLRREAIGFVFQSFNLVPTFNARENITLPMDIAGRKPDEEWLDTVIDAVGLRDRLTHRPNELSGGQQQRVACARALASRPQVVFADEPTGNLDSRTSVEIMALFQELSRAGITLLLVTHEPDIARYTSRVVVMRDGRVQTDRRQPPLVADVGAAAAEAAEMASP